MLNKVVLFLTNAFKGVKENKEISRITEHTVGGGLVECDIIACFEKWFCCKQITQIH